MNRRQEGVTLVEVLVVIFILAVLLGAGGYLIAGALASARAVDCLDKLKMQGVALFAVVQASPITGVPGLKGHELPKVQDAAGVTWKELFLKHGGASADTFVCRDALRSDRPSYGMNPLAGANWSYPRQMFYSGFLLMPGETKPRNQDLIKSPARTLIIAEAGRVDPPLAAGAPEDWLEIESAWLPYVALPFSDTTGKNYGATFNYGYDWGNTAPGNCRGTMEWDQYRRPLPRRNKRCSALFLDGHAEGIEMQKLLGAAWGTPDCLFGNQ